MAENERQYKTSAAQRKATAKYDKESVQQYTVRVPKGKLDELKVYCEQKHKEEELNPKYQSLNTLIIAALEKETGLNIKNMLEEIQYYYDSIEAKEDWLLNNPMLSDVIKAEFKKNEEYKRGWERFLNMEWEESKADIIAKYRAKKKELENDSSIADNKTDSQS